MTYEATLRQWVKFGRPSSNTHISQAELGILCRTTGCYGADFDHVVER